MTTIMKGANVPIDAGSVRAELSWTGGAGVPDIDGSALLLRDTGRVSSDDDFVFYNQPGHPSGAARHAGKNGTVDAVEIDIASLPDAIERVVLAASADGGTFTCASCSPTPAPAQRSLSSPSMLPQKPQWSAVSCTAAADSGSSVRSGRDMPAGSRV